MDTTVASHCVVEVTQLWERLLPRHLLCQHFSQLTIVSVRYFLFFKIRVQPSNSNTNNARLLM